jgi:phage protein D
MGRKESGGLKEVSTPETPNLAEAMFAGLTSQATRFIPGITATLTTFGVPDIKPGIYVVVENVGALYQGTYALNGVTHTWSGQEIESTLTLRAYTPQVSDTVLPIIKLETNPSGAQ